ncbi:hypothetical protein ACUNH4_10395, partial [Serratia sp. IR-2025]
MENAAPQKMSRKQSAGGSVRAVLSIRASLNPALLRIGGRLRHRAPNIGHKKGSSRFTGERCFDFQEEVSVIPVSIGHPL